MFDDGLLKLNAQGQYEAVRDEAESEYIRSEVSKTKRKKTMTPEEADLYNVTLDNLNKDLDSHGLE